MNNFLLTSALLWVYSLFVNEKSLAGFDSLLTKRTPPLSGFFIFMSVIIICPLVSFGRVFWGALWLAGLCPGLSTRFIRPPASRTGAVYQTVNKGANHDNI